MIKRETIEGRDATVVYLDRKFRPVDEDKAELIKVIFDNGDLWFAVPVKDNAA